MILTLSVANSIIKPEMHLQLVLQVPSGVTITGEGITGGCTVQCSVPYLIPSGQNKEFAFTAVAGEPGIYEIESQMVWYFGGDPETTQGGKSETLRLQVSTPEEPPAPTPTSEPTPEPTLPPHVGQPTLNLHATQTEVTLGDPVRLQLSVVNSIARPVMTLKLILQVPSGWSMSGSGFAGSCTGQCTATYDVASGDQRSIDIEMQPNQAGSFTAESQMEWWFGNDVSTLDGTTVSLPLTVLGQTTATQRNAATRGVTAPAAVTPTSPPPPPPVVPARESGGGCNSVSDYAGPASLALMGLLILPAVGLVGRNILPRLPLRRPDGMGRKVLAMRGLAGIVNRKRNKA